MSKLGDVERRIFETEGFRVKITHRGKGSDARSDIKGLVELPYDIALKGNKTVNEWKNERFATNIQGRFSVKVLDGKGKSVDGGVELITVRNTYPKRVRRNDEKGNPEVIGSLPEDCTEEERTQQPNRLVMFARPLFAIGELTLGFLNETLQTVQDKLDSGATEAEIKNRKASLARFEMKVGFPLSETKAPMQQCACPYSSLAHIEGRSVPMCDATGEYMNKDFVCPKDKQGNLAEELKTKDRKQSVTRFEKKTGIALWKVKSPLSSPCNTCSSSKQTALEGYCVLICNDTGEYMDEDYICPKTK